MADAWEAVLGAIFLDAGYDLARAWAARSYGDKITQAKKLAEQANPKGQLQELLQSRNQPVPLYDLVESVGPDHEKVFTIRVLLSDQEIGRGTGRSRKSAESNAAAHALAQII